MTTPVEGEIVSDAVWVEAHCETLADVVSLYRELRETRAKLAAVEAEATDQHYGDSFDLADSILRIIHGG